MHQSEEEHLIEMINQIALNNISAGDESAVADVIAGHVKKFWPRRMKVILKNYIDQGGSELHPAALSAGKKLFVAID
ncbi:formate dehydrogenase subunit delta [Marinomonas sp. RSW2]|uniref:Formate dehydrogenase subunit delta n=1 Tax=Marinomonas maritima TaxID=2940935 RepID=A0ABT5WEB0_9GAMM|nr:formate dehydrogenase subunit delta [Marinomonas maritima]MDE8603155.1 formate dehydrogenase subunit delta [Marinomonas maritima]